MKNKHIAFILLAFLVTAPVMARAASTPRVASGPEETVREMTDTELASYISGRLKQALQSEEERAITQACGAAGCDVVVQ